MQPRPNCVNETTYEIQCAHAPLWVIVTEHEGKMFEVFLHSHESHPCVDAEMSALSVAVTIGLRRGVRPEEFVEHLRGVKCGHVSPNPDVANSVGDALARAMKLWLDGHAEQGAKIEPDRPDKPERERPQLTLGSTFAINVVNAIQVNS